MKTSMKERFLMHQAKNIELSKITGQGENFNKLSREEQAEYIRLNMGIRTEKARRQSIAVKQLKIKKAKREYLRSSTVRKNQEVKMTVENQAEIDAREHQKNEKAINKKLGLSMDEIKENDSSWEDSESESEYSEQRNENNGSPENNRIAMLVDFQK